MENLKRKCTEGVGPRKLPKPTVLKLTQAEGNGSSTPISAAKQNPPAQSVVNATCEQGIVKWNLNNYIMAEGQNHTLVDIKGLSKLIGIDIDVNHFMFTIQSIDSTVKPTVDFVTLPDSHNNENVIGTYLSNLVLWKFLNKGQ